eukprot:COSAG05_NODE_68_length_22188_cov_8.265019_12_plen_74_part_00
MYSRHAMRLRTEPMWPTPPASHRGTSGTAPGTASGGDAYGAAGPARKGRSGECRWCHLFSLWPPLVTQVALYY